jgi:hypothetical protein
MPAARERLDATARADQPSWTMNCVQRQPICLRAMMWTLPMLSTRVTMPLAVKI